MTSASLNAFYAKVQRAFFAPDPGYPVTLNPEVSSQRDALKWEIERLEDAADALDYANAKVLGDTVRVAIAEKQSQLDALPPVETAIAHGPNQPLFRYTGGFDGV